MKPSDFRTKVTNAAPKGSTVVDAPLAVYGAT